MGSEATCSCCIDLGVSIYLCLYVSIYIIYIYYKCNASLGNKMIWLVTIGDLLETLCVELPVSMRVGECICMESLPHAYVSLWHLGLHFKGIPLWPRSRCTSVTLQWRPYTCLRCVYGLTTCVYHRLCICQKKWTPSKYDPGDIADVCRYIIMIKFIPGIYVAAME